MNKELSTIQLQTELDELILWFESDNVDLDLAIKKYQRGTEIIAELQSRLKTAENIIKKITKS
ncbi:MAG: exodeoxyribonuclease VII small subunit [bacterium]